MDIRFTGTVIHEGGGSKMFLEEFHCRQSLLDYISRLLARSVQRTSNNPVWAVEGNSLEKA